MTRTKATMSTEEQAWWAPERIEEYEKAEAAANAAEFPRGEFPPQANVGPLL